jgi:alpha-mannosidase
VFVPAGIATDTVLADSQFTVVERIQRKYNTKEFTIEHPAAVAPMQRFVAVQDAGRAVVVMTDGLPEYELLPDGKGTVAVTLLRCVGLLAGEDLLTRPGGKAGWHNETPDAQCRGIHTFRYAVMPLSRTAMDERVLLESELEAFMSLESGRLTMSALKQSEDGTAFIVRFYNTGATRCEETVRFARPVHRAELARLDETPMRRLPVEAGNVIRCSVPPAGVITLRVTFAPM